MTCEHGLDRELITCQQCEDEDKAKRDAARFEGIEPAFHSVVETYGRDMFALVYNAGMAQQAVQVLAEQAQKHGSRKALHAISVVSAAFNQASNTLVIAKGWTPEEIAQCERDLQRAWAAKIQIAPASLLDN